MSKCIRFQIIFVFFSALLAQDAVPSKADVRRKAFPELFQITELAQSVPPEFAAQTLLRVAASPRLTDKVWKRELIESAFERASVARVPIRHMIMPGVITPARPVFQSQAESLGLDRLSLHSSAVQSMLPIDPARARALFESIPPSVINPLTCADALWEDVRPYDQALSLVVNQTFSTEERRKEEHVNFVLAALQRIQSPVEIAPMAAAIRSLKITAEQRELVVTKLAGIVDAMQSGDRAFSSAMFEANKEVGEFKDAYPAFTAAWRKFIVRQLTRKRCSESVDPKWAYPKMQADVVKALGLTKEESTPAAVDGAAILVNDYDRPELKQLQQKWFHLMFGGQRNALPDARKSTNEWREELIDYRNAIEALTAADGQSEADFFQFKGGYLQQLIWTVPAGPDREKLLASYISFIKTSPQRQENWLQWFHGIASLVDLVHSTHHELKQSLLDALEQSGDATLILYSRLEKTMLSREAR